MAKKNEVVTYPRIVEAGKIKDPITGAPIQTYEYQFLLGQTQTLKIKNLLEAYPFCEGFALVRVLDEKGNKVYKYLGENGKLSYDGYFKASPYSGGRALCQREEGGKAQYREFDGRLDPQMFDANGAQGYKSATSAEINAGMDVSNKLNLLGFGEVMIGGKKNIINMLGEYPTNDLSKQEVVDRGAQLYNFYVGKLNLADLDSRYMADGKFADYIKRVIIYKYNLSLIEYFNSAKSDIKEFKTIMDIRSKNLKQFYKITDDLKKQETRHA